jgi:hypothetical protein
MHCVGRATSETFISLLTCQYSQCASHTSRGLLLFDRGKSSRNSFDRKSRDFVEVKDRKKTREMKISRKNSRLTSQKIFARFTPKKLEKKNSRFFFLKIWVA